MKGLLKGVVLASLTTLSALSVADPRDAIRENGGPIFRASTHSDDNPRSRSYRGRNEDVQVNIIAGPPSHSRGRGNGYGNNQITIIQQDPWSAGAIANRYYRNNVYPFNTLGNSFGYQNQPQVIIQHNTIVTRPQRTSTITRITTTRKNSGISLLRDINGRCYERAIDSRGNEIRTELDPRECDY